MNRSRRNRLLIEALLGPETLVTLPVDRWSGLIREARKADLLGRLGSRLDAAGLLQRVPAAPRAHLDSAQVLALAQHAEVRREVQQLCRLLQPLGLPVVLLKGAAYNHAGLIAAQGRMFSDIDILVPKAGLPAVEAALMLDGWATTHHSGYDQHYYRKWMHELPPMQHIRRGTVLDVHHAILPETARMRPDSARLLEQIEAVAGLPGIYVLGPVDMVLHSMAHLFCNEEFSHGLRDLSDIDLLLRQFGAQPDFWSRLLLRAQELGLQRPLYYGLRQTRFLLECPVPQSVLEQTRADAPPAPVRQLMDHLWQRVLGSASQGRSGLFGGGHELLLLVRAHWLRMPVWLLGFHIIVKLTRRKDA